MINDADGDANHIVMDRLKALPREPLYEGMQPAEVEAALRRVAQRLTNAVQAL